MHAAAGIDELAAANGAEVAMRKLVPVQHILASKAAPHTSCRVSGAQA